MGKKDKVVVFGGAGFLGSHVADALSEASYQVLIFDIKKSPYLRKDQNQIIGDILDKEQVQKAICGAKYVYNFAGIADISEASNKPVDVIKYNVLGHTIILNACVSYNVERIFFASSIYVYSNAGSFYRVSKQACELLTETFYERYGLKYTILRYGSLYGPRAQMWNGVYRYVYQALIEKRIDHPGTGEEKREYIHVLDAARLSVEVLKPEFENESVIITGTQTLTSRELLTMINEMLEGNVKINFQNKNVEHHYTVTPYTFSPKLGRKLVSSSFVDIGQGILQVMDEIFRTHHREYKKISDIYVRED